MSLKSKLEKRSADYVDLDFCLDRRLAKSLAEARLEQGRAEGAYGAGKSKALRDLEKQVLEASVTIRITAMPWPEYHALVNEHPPREGFPGEVFNPNTFYVAAAKQSASEVTDLGSTVPIHDEDWDEFVNGLTDGELDRLAGAVHQLNRDVSTVDIASLR